MEGEGMMPSFKNAVSEFLPLIGSAQWQRDLAEKRMGEAYESGRASVLAELGICAAYVGAAAAANISAAHFGPVSLPVNALLLVGLDLSARDALHERWSQRGSWWRMAGLICAGSLVSALVAPSSARISAASAAAFLASGAVDTAAFHLLGKHGVAARANGSNVASAAVDSLVFPALAFGAVAAPVVVLQFAAKTLGGAAWVAVLRRVGALR